MHAAFVLPNLGAGGAERVTLDLIAGFLSKGAKVDLILMQKWGEYLPQVPAGVRLITLGADRLRHAVLPLRRYFKAERPDAVLAAMWPLTSATLAAAAGLKVRPRVVVADHAPLLDQYADSKVTLATLRLSLPISYRLADSVVAASDGLASEISALSKLPRATIKTIHNPIPKPASSAQAMSPWPANCGKRILSVGRLKPVKNFPQLIEAFAPLAREQDAVLTILGEGSERPTLEAMIASLGLQNRVLLPGYTATPGDWYRDADLFVLASAYEGFGNVLIEAMHFGTAVVATDCPYGPSELLGSGRWGTLVPCGDTTALTAAVRSALLHPVDRAKQISRAVEFGTERAVDAYWQALAG